MIRNRSTSRVVPMFPVLLAPGTDVWKSADVKGRDVPSVRSLLVQVEGRVQ